MLCDAEGRRVPLPVTLDFTGWRFKSFPVRGSIDWSRIEYVLLEINHIAPRGKVAVGVASVRAVPELHVARPIRALTLTVGERTVKLPVSLQPNRCVTIDALGRGTEWPGGMAEGRRFAVEGGAMMLAPGPNDIAITLEPGGDYAGDVSVRACRTWPLEE
jgi:hypothetical protein